MHLKGCWMMGWLVPAVLILLAQRPWVVLGQYQGYNQYNNQRWPPPYQQGPPPQYNPAIGQGSRDYGDVCNMNSNDESNCDVGRGLLCVQSPQRGFICVCDVSGTIYRNGKCRAKVARRCESELGTPIGCVINAECHPATRICQCKRSYLSNDEGTACNSGQRTKLTDSIYCLFPLILSYVYRQIFH